eukprot:1186812-Prorocentrum_minimum.AAC.1
MTAQLVVREGAGPTRVTQVCLRSARLIFPTEACTLVLMVSSGCIKNVVDPEARPPAAAAMAKPFAANRRSGGGQEGVRRGCITKATDP